MPVSVKPYRTPVSGSLALRLHVSVMLIKATLQMHTSHRLAVCSALCQFQRACSCPQDRCILWKRWTRLGRQLQSQGRNGKYQSQFSHEGNVPKTERKWVSFYMGKEIWASGLQGSH